MSIQFGYLPIFLSSSLNHTNQERSQGRQSHMYRETEDPSKSTEPTMALARRDLSSKRAHTTSEVSTSKECASGDRVQGGVTLPARPMSTSPSPAAPREPQRHACQFARLILYIIAYQSRRLCTRRAVFGVAWSIVVLYGNFNLRLLT